MGGTRAFIDFIGSEGVASPALAQQLIDAGIPLASEGSSKGTLAAHRIVFADGTELESLRVTPDTDTQMGEVIANVASAPCVSAHALRDAYALKEVPAMIGLPAPSSTPQPTPSTIAHAFEGRVGKNKLSIRYFAPQEDWSADGCIVDLVLRYPLERL
jgi:hypothetical protein